MLRPKRREQEDQCKANNTHQLTRMQIEPAKAETVSKSDEEVDKQDECPTLSHLHETERCDRVVRDHPDKSSNGRRVGHGKCVNGHSDTEDEEGDGNCQDFRFVALDVSVAKDRIC